MPNPGEVLAMAQDDYDSFSTSEDGRHVYEASLNLEARIRLFAQWKTNLFVPILRRDRVRARCTAAGAALGAFDGLPVSL